MATITGNAGIIKVDGVAVIEVRNYSLELTTDTIETTVMGDGSRQYVKGLSSFSGSCDVYWDPDHFEDTTGADIDGLIQGAVGDAPVTLEVYPEGGTTVKWAGNIVVTGYSISAAMDGMVEASLSFQGSGGVTYTAA